MNKIEKYILLLNEILVNPKNRDKNVNKFVVDIFNEDETIYNEEIDTLLANLASNIDYYSPDPEIRREDPCYIDEESVIKEIEPVLKKVKEIIKSEI